MVSVMIKVVIQMKKDVKDSWMADYECEHVNNDVLILVQCCRVSVHSCQRTHTFNKMLIVDIGGGRSREPYGRLRLRVH